MPAYDPPWVIAEDLRVNEQCSGAERIGLDFMAEARQGWSAPLVLPRQFTGATGNPKQP
jgi:hypothetical protein